MLLITCTVLQSLSFGVFLPAHWLNYKIRCSPGTRNHLQYDAFLFIVMVCDLFINCLIYFCLPGSGLVSLGFPKENIMLYQARGLERACELSAFNLNKLDLFTVALVSLEEFSCSVAQ